MSLSVSKLTSKYQATVPKSVRIALHLHAHDHILYEISKNNTVTLKKITGLDTEYLDSLKHTLSEWESDNDEQAYKNL
jgi:antitoxin PrlF